jgi:catechol 2,3-dioxygenase-like lactoylglutathione lyase family enzyme
MRSANCTPHAALGTAPAIYDSFRERSGVATMTTNEKETGMPIGRLDHYSIRTFDLEASRRFYTEIMGFISGPRPPFDFPGLWLYASEPTPDSNGVVHIIGIDPNNPEGLKAYLGDKDASALEGTGTVDHIAFRAEGLADMRQRCLKTGTNFRERTVPALGLHQVFIEDPSGVTIELNYPAAEA